MDGFVGLTPLHGIDERKILRDKDGNKIIIEINEYGYTIIYADYSTEHEDVNDTSDNNMKRAIEVLRMHELIE